MIDKDSIKEYRRKNDILDFFKDLMYAINSYGYRCKLDVTKSDMYNNTYYTISRKVRFGYAEVMEGSVKYENGRDGWGIKTGKPGVYYTIRVIPKFFEAIRPLIEKDKRTWKLKFKSSIKGFTNRRYNYY